MPSRLESEIEKRVCKQATLEGWWALKLVCNGHRGFPDRWFIRSNVGDNQPTIVLMEFKAPGKRARKLQEWVCQRLEDIGFNVHRNVDDYSMAMEILREHDEV